MPTKKRTKKQTPTARLDKLENKLDDIFEEADPDIQGTLRWTADHLRLEHNALLARVAALEKRCVTPTGPVYTSAAGKPFAIAQMSVQHLQNAILKILRGERHVSAMEFKALLEGAEARGLDWQSWTARTPPVSGNAPRT